MKVQIPRNELKEAVAGFGKVVNGKASTLPILGGVRFENNGHGIVASVTDLDQHLRFTFAGAQATGKGAFVVPLAALRELVKTGTGQEPIEFETGRDDVVTVTNHVGGHAVQHPLNGFDADEWPTLPPAVETKEAAGFLETYRRLFPFLSQDESRYIITGVHVEVASEGEHPVTMIATDGRRLSLWNSMNLPLTESVTVPASKFLTWNGLQGNVGIGLRTEKRKEGEEAVGFALSLGPWYFDTKLIQGTYPNWRHVVPARDDDALNRITFTDADALSLKKILPSFPGADTPSATVALRPGPDGTLVIAGRGTNDPKETTLELSGGSRFEGKMPGIGINAYYLLDALDAGFRVFSTNDEWSPLRSDDGRGGLHVTMPIRLGLAPAPKPAAAPKADEPPTQTNEDAATTSPGGAATTPPATPAGTTEEPKGTTMTKEGEGTTNGTPEQGTALERLQAVYEAARAKIREANAALADVAGAIRDAVKENKQLKADVENVRAGLAKLQQIKV